MVAADWLTLQQAQGIDFTLAWRHLAAAAGGDEAPLRALFTDSAGLDLWLPAWSARCVLDEGEEEAEVEGKYVAAGHARAARMRDVNPWVIPRNHLVEAALAAASDDDDLRPLQALLAAVRRPFEQTPDLAGFATPAPAAVTACYRTYCGT